MNRTTEHKIELSWNQEGSYSATIVNGAVTLLNFCAIGKGSEDCGSCLTSIDLKYLEAIHQNLGELFKEIEEERKRLGHVYRTDEEEA